MEPVLPFERNNYHIIPVPGFAGLIAGPSSFFFQLRSPARNEWKIK